MYARLITKLIPLASGAKNMPPSKSGKHPAISPLTECR